MTSGSTPVVVLEYFAAGGRLGGGGDGDGSMTGEGRALLRALLRDLAALPGVAPVAVAEPASAPPLLDGLRDEIGLAPADGDPIDAAIHAAAERRGARLWPVAPETQGRLAAACRAAEEAGVPLVGSPSAGVRRAARRRRLLRRLEGAGLATPPTREAPTPSGARERARGLGWPAVVKPGRGAGGAGTTRVEGPDDVEPAWSRAAAVEPRVPPMVQSFVEGVPASVLLLCAGREGVRPLAFSRQRVRFDPGARYEGGETPLRHPMAGPALEAAREAAAAAGGLRGLAGVDLVLAPEGPVVVEINPRLTTSYLGLRRHAGPAAAAGALRASGSGRAGPDLDAARLPLGLAARGPEPVRFGPDGGS